MDFEKVKLAAQGYEKDMTKFLRDLIAIPGESCGEEGVIRRIEKEMKAVGFDQVVVDPMGNVLGTMGTGEKLIAFDAHIDTVGVGNRDNWKFDPYKGYENETEIGGRGASDQLGGIVSAVYGAKVMGCDSVCLNCVDVCPNRANETVWLDGRMQIVHIDGRCNECGNCSSFCPYRSAPYLDKLTWFADEAALRGSHNPGWTLLPDGDALVRLDGKEYVGPLEGMEIPADVVELMRETLRQMPWLNTRGC